MLCWQDAREESGWYRTEVLWDLESIVLGFMIAELFLSVFRQGFPTIAQCVNTDVTSKIRPLQASLRCSR